MLFFKKNMYHGETALHQEKQFYRNTSYIYLINGVIQVYMDVIKKAPIVLWLPQSNSSC